MHQTLNAETLRLEEGSRRRKNWQRWGPYLAERQWGTVREDYSENGDAWNYFSHDQARSRAYRWGEDGLLGICDRECRLCFALALWNGRDPILKERLFGLTGPEGNHGEDVKECYYYLDSTPTHSYMKALYKYPAGRVSVRAACRGEPSAQQSRSGVRARRYGRVRRQSLLRRLRRVCQGVARRHADPHHGRQSRAGTGDDPCAADVVVPQRLDVGLHARRLRGEAADGSGRPVRRRRPARLAGRISVGHRSSSRRWPGRAGVYGQ